MNKQTFSDFVQRTDVLASRLRVRLGDLPTRLEVSRASFFAYRSGKSPITSKAWRKLERAERESGISPPLAEQIASAPTEEKGALIASASLEEVLSLLPVEERARIAANFIDSQVERMELEMHGFFLDAQALASLVRERKPSRSELLFFASKVEQALDARQKTWQSLVQRFRELLGLDPRSLSERVADDARGRKRSAVEPPKSSDLKKGRKKKR